jgi:hypothetical protein
MWRKIKKISGKNTRTSITALKDQDGRIYTDQQQIDEYTLDFRNIKVKEEQRQMGMEDLEWEEYNESYKLEELRSMHWDHVTDTLPDVERIMAAHKKGTSKWL